ncbi:MAG: hypothetical protein WDO19_06040 [Bacteroidota bacterium]
MQLNYFTYKEETFTCPACGWSGKGIDLGTGDLAKRILSATWIVLPVIKQLASGKRH